MNVGDVILPRTTCSSYDNWNKTSTVTTPRSDFRRHGWIYSYHCKKSFKCRQYARTVSARSSGPAPVWNCY